VITQETAATPIDQADQARQCLPKQLRSVKEIGHSVRTVGRPVE
jgi:hypothetical protein